MGAYTCFFKKQYAVAAAWQANTITVFVLKPSPVAIASAHAASITVTTAKSATSFLPAVAVARSVFYFCRSCNILQAHRVGVSFFNRDLFGDQLMDIL